MGSKLKQVGGSLENLEPQQIMTGKPAF